MRHELTVEATEGGARLDTFVGARLQLSRSRLRQLFEAGQVRVDGRRARKGDSLAAGQRVVVEHEAVSAAATGDASVPLAVLHEDEALVVVDKPAGMPCQPLQPGESGTVANALLARYPEMSGVGDDPREAGLCHRLDVETSGVLLAARTRPAWEALRAAFGAEREVDKRYLALVAGPLAEAGVIEVPLKHAGDHVRPDFAEGRPARTEFRVVARRGPYALVEVQLVTGVLHQVRAHLAGVGAPIVGDRLYDGPEEPGLGRFFLHAAALAVTHPTTGHRLQVASPLPPELAAVLARRVPGAHASRAQQP
jgi:23S rRNA pseudouridine1911/1915/1917 synthase